MAEPSTIARPYAEAVFKLADASGSLAKWSEMLAALFIAILAGKLSGEAENFVRVLAQNNRLPLLPEIHGQFEALKNEREGVVEAEVQSAFELTEAQLADLIQRLEKKTGRKVRAQVSVDRELIGGVKVALGDKVIDGSARGQLS